MAWQTHPPQRSPEVPVKGLRARPEGRPGHGRLGVAHTEVTGFTCRGAGRSPSGMPCLPRQRIKGFESRSEQDDCYFCGSICDAERESHEEPARAHHGARRGHADLPGRPASPRPKGRGGSGALSPGPFRPAHADPPRRSTCARSSPASGGVRRAPRSHSWRSRSSGARRSSRTEEPRVRSASLVVRSQRHRPPQETWGVNSQIAPAAIHTGLQAYPLARSHLTLPRPSRSAPHGRHRPGTGSKGSRPGHVNATAVVHA